MKPEMTLEQRKWLDEQLKDFNCIYVGHHGSFLYGLNREGSDLDIKAVYLPSKTDLILGKAIKTYNRKNDDLDIEVEIKSLSSFLQSAQSCDTNCVDLLHSPKDMQLLTTPLWDEMVKYRSCIFAKNMKGIVGYIKTHSKKYTNKIDRLNEMKWLRDLCVDIKTNYPDDLVKDVAESSELSDMLIDRQLKYIKPVTLVQDHEQQYLEVCGKKYIYTWSVDQLISAMEHEINRYGKRSNDGVDKGMDAKSLSHALRVLCELEEILTTNTISFPLKDREWLLKVKLAEIPYEEVMNEIDTRYDKCMSLLENCNLPEYNDLSPMYKVVENYYFN